MFRAEINAGLLKSAVSSVNALVDECKVRLEEDGLSVKAVDPAKVGMVDLDVPSDSFESYETDGEVLGVNLTRFKDIIGMANKGQDVAMELDEETGKLHIRMDGLHYTLSLIAPDSIRGEPDLSELDLSGEVVVAGKEISRGIKAAGMVSDHMAFGIHEGEFFMEAQGDTDDVHIHLDEEDVVYIEGEEARSLYSLEYLNSMSKAIPGDSQVTIEIGTDYPIKMHFDISDGEGHITYLLAPRSEIN